MFSLAAAKPAAAQQAPENAIDRALYCLSVDVCAEPTLEMTQVESSKLRLPRLNAAARYFSWRKTPSISSPFTIFEASRDAGNATKSIMKRCTVSALNSFSSKAARSRLPICQRRCRSYRKQELDQRALLDRVNSSFGEDTYATPLSVDAEKKTITTSEGELPISPLFDPSWIQARRRKTKEAPSPTGRFRKKLQNNPYGTRPIILSRA